MVALGQKQTCAAQLAMSALGQKRTSAYSITSSSRASTDGGTVRPSAFAIFRLIISLNLIGACIGRSPGCGDTNRLTRQNGVLCSNRVPI
jgi:hypothetical protein